jgi:hypothetical protein
MQDYLLHHFALEHLQYKFHNATMYHTWLVHRIYLESMRLEGSNSAKKVHLRS